MASHNDDGITLAKPPGRASPAHGQCAAHALDLHVIPIMRGDLLVPRRGQIGAGLVEPADEFGTFSRVLVLVQGANSVPLFAPPNCPRQVPPHRLVATCRVERSAGRSEHLTLHPLKQPPVIG